MADRYQDRNFMADDLDRGLAPRGPARSESDPLAELARLIGQNDPFAGAGRPGPKVQVPPKVAPEPVRAPEPLANDPLAAAGPPPWMQQQRAGGGSRPEAPRQPQQAPAQEQNFQEPVHPLHRYGAAQPAPQQQAFEDPAFPEDDEQNEPSRYDDALFGQRDRGGQELQRHQDYADDPYAFEEEDGYDEGDEEDQKRGGGFAKVLMVLALAVVGTGGAFAYRAYVGSPQNGDPPIIRADNSPTKIMPSPSDGSPKVPDRLGMERTERMVSREEAPVDINATRSGGPRVVFPQGSQGGNPPPAPPMNVATNDPPPPTPSAPVTAPPSSGTMANGEPRRIKTMSIRGDQAAEPAAAPAAAPPVTRSMAAKPGRKPPASANASADSPMSLSPQAATPAAAETRMASTNAADTGVTPTNGYLVQVSSQRSEADAQTSYRSLQTKFPDMLGQRPPVIKRADLGEKGIYYRAMVGPFGTPDEAVQMCNNLKTAGGQCVVQKK
jgi:hypothetical protein